MRRVSLSLKLNKVADFLLSATDTRQLPFDEGIEFAFIGRSNAGKSSTINALPGMQKLARTSKTPGRTQHLNAFQWTETQRIIDLPGSGYAKVPPKMRAEWQKLIRRYLTRRRSLQAVVLVMDVRHPLQPVDINLLQWCQEQPFTVIALLNKVDKIKRGPATDTLLMVEKQLKTFLPDAQALLFSAKTKQGLPDLLAALEKAQGPC